MAYVADVTPAEKRAKSYGLIGMAFGVGFVLGPALGGLLGSVDPRLPFWAAAACSLANAAYGYFVLPESLPVAERAVAFEWRRANPIGSLKFLRSHAELAGLAGAAFLSNLAHAVLPAVFVLYAGYRFGWEREGRRAGAGGRRCLVGRRAGHARSGRACIGSASAACCSRGLTAGAVGFLVYALAPTPLVFLCGIPIVALWGLAGPSAQGLMTRYVGPSAQGELQGAMGSLQGIATMIGPATFAAAFAYSIGAGKSWHFPGAAYALASSLLLASALLAAYTTRLRPVPG